MPNKPLTHDEKRAKLCRYCEKKGSGMRPLSSCKVVCEIIKKEYPHLNCDPNDVTKPSSICACCRQKVTKRKPLPVPSKYTGLLFRTSGDALKNLVNCPCLMCGDASEAPGQLGNRFGGGKAAVPHPRGRPADSSKPPDPPSPRL